MKTRVFSLFIGLVSIVQIVMAQNAGFKMNVKMTDGSFFSVAADDVEEVYFTTTNEKQFEDTYYTVSGRAEKGPFKSGSTVTLQPLDLTLNALGLPQTTMTFDDCGNYAFRNTLFKYPYVQLTATGLFFNEYDDYKTQDYHLTLQGYADLQHGSKANVNVVTHLISERVLNLVIGGVDFDVALSQAQGEFLSIFGLQHLNNKDFTQVSITDGDDYAAALLAITMPLLYNRKGADLISWMTRLRYDFADDGKFTEQNKEQYKKDRNSLNLSNNVRKIVEKYQEYGLTISVKDLFYFYDWDEDGIAGNEVYDPSQPAIYDATNICAPMEGGTFVVNVISYVPLYTSPINSGENVPVNYDPTRQYIQTDMSLTTEYENGKWTIKVAPARYRYISDRTVYLYDAVGNIVASINISQEGNPEGAYLSEYGKAFVSNICQILALCHSKYRIADAKYTGLTDNSDFHAPLELYNYYLDDLFSNPYQLIYRNYELFRTTQSDVNNLFMPMIVLTNTLAYYELTVMFGDVPLITTEQDMYGYIPRTSQETILAKHVEELISLLNRMPDIKAGYINSPDGIALPARDLVRVMLADIYMYQGNYGAAKGLLEEIVNSGRYNIIAGQNRIDGTCSEIVWSLDASNSSNITRSTTIDYNSPYSIVKTFADVLLSLAECENKTDNDAKAKEYLSQVTSIKGIEVTSTETIAAISEVRSIIQADFGGYFAFLKRNGIAQSVLGLENYQLLFPIPQNQISRNPYLTQNPGYEGTTR